MNFQLDAHHTLSLPVPNGISHLDISPVVLTAIIDHHLRRNSDQPRVIGTLLGYRSDDGKSLHITSCFPVPHTEEKEQIAVDMDYHRTMYELHVRVQPKEVIIGWYATGQDLFAYASLVQDFYSKEAAPLSAVHLTVDTDMKDDTLAICGYTSCNLTNDEAEDCMFLPVPCKVLAHQQERIAMDVVNGALGDEQGLGQFVGDVHALETSVYRLMELLDRVGDYVRGVLAKSTKENMVLGRALLSVVTHVPKIDTADFSKAFNSHLQDLLMVMYLAEVTKSQLAITESMQLLV